MSIPRKHHYVPVTHIEHFKSDEGYFLGIKLSKEIHNKKSATSFFKTRDLNSSIDERTEAVDHKRVEDELNSQWDGPFQIHHDKMVQWISDSLDRSQISEIDINDTLQFFFEYTIIGYFRRAKLTKQYSESSSEILESLDCVIDTLDSETLEENISPYSEFIEFARNFKQKAIRYQEVSEQNLRYPTPTPVRIKELVPRDCSVDVFIIIDNDSFILPDTTGTFLKSDKTIKVKGLDIHQVSSVGIPISSNIFIQIKNNDLRPEEENNIAIPKPEKVDYINDLLYSTAIHQVVACEQNAILKQQNRD
jgi:hypothetical protein